jgi:hypothetical protein
MLLYVFALLLFVHGCIHLVGFAKGFNIRAVPLLTEHISKPLGALWFLTALLFFAATVIVLFKIKLWWVAVGFALLLSEVLIITNWRNAKPGSFINLLLLLLMLLLLHW